MSQRSFFYIGTRNEVINRNILTLCNISSSIRVINCKSVVAGIVNISNLLFIHYHIHIKIHNDEFQMNCHKEPVKLFVCYLSLYFP